MGSLHHGRKTIVKRLTAAAVLFAIVILISGCTEGNKTILLRYKFVQGTTTIYETSYKGITRIQIGDSVVVDRSHEVISRDNVYVRKMVDDTTYDLLETRTLRFHIVNRLDSSIVDTTRVEDPVIMRVTTRGRVLLAGPPEELTRQISEKSSDSYTQELPVFPVDLITRGQEWTQETTILDGDRTLKATTTYKVESFLRERGFDCVTVSYQGNAVLPPNKSEPGDRHVTNRLSVNGLMYFAYTEGFVVSQRERRIIEGTGYQNWKEKEKLPVRVAVEYDIELRLVQPPKKTN